MSVTNQFRVKANIEKVWEVLGNQFHEISKWTPQVLHSEKKSSGNLIPGAPSSGRVCQTAQGEIDETFTHFDKEKKTFAYIAKSKNFPFFIKGVENVWSIKAINAKETEIIRFPPVSG